MYRKIFSEKTLSLFILIFSSLGFSTGIIAIRLYSGTDSLAYIINLQSIVVFTSFILQFGLRAAIRVHIYNRRLRLAKVSYDSLYLLLAFLSIIGFSVEFYSDTYVFISLSCLLAIVTLNLTIGIAKNNFKSIVYLSVVNFLVAFGSSVILLIFKTPELTSVFIEVTSIVVFISIYRKVNWTQLHKYKIPIVRVYWSAQSYQLGSCVVALFIFLLTQSAVIQFEGSALNAYSDALILSGFLVLLLGKGMLLFERRLYNSVDKQYLLYISLIVIQILVSAIFSAIISHIYDVNWVLMLSVIFVLLSRTTVGYIVQYVENNRGVLNYVSGFFFIGYIIVYILGFKNIDITYHSLPVLMYLLVGFFLFKKNR